ncbi:macro domain-containing protein [Acaryochloris thomasi]|nr:macro domain-containing protein [Acaryochloris thomasi]
MTAIELQLILVDPVAELCQELQHRFDGMNSVSVVNGYFEDLDRYDCMVSAGNSFGLMDGGVDLAIIRYFGLDLMDTVQRHILKDFRGEQPVGTSFIVNTEHPQHPFLAHTPTMRIPMSIAQTDNVYQAMWAALLAVWHHNQQHERKIYSVACPGLGTATGRMPFKQAAKQMMLAYKHFLNPPEYISWPYATIRQNAIGAGGDLS